MEWDLYTDESGQFSASGEPTLIGGFLCPHDRRITEAVIRRWRDEIRSRGCREGIFTPEMLERGDTWHFIKNKPDDEEYEAIRALPRYVFDHCCENTSSRKPLEDWEGQLAQRWQRQLWVLRQYRDRIEACGGCFVIFNNPQGTYHVDNNTTYLTVYSRGLLCLYFALRERYPGERIFLNLHTASRKNMTRAEEPDKCAVSPLAGDAETLGRELYINQIKNCLFLNGGHVLLNERSFARALREMEILRDAPKRDIKRGNYWEPNPYTVVCDYICNSYLQVLGNREDYRPVFCNAVVLDTFERHSFDTYLLNLDEIAEKKLWNRGFIELFSLDYPGEKTANYFAQLREAGYPQHSVADALTEYLHEYVRDRVRMESMAGRMESAIEKTKEYMEPDAYAYLRANLLLYLDALYTHMGRTGDVDRVTDAFAQTVLTMDDAAQRDKLILLFCNREIVTCTDAFRYARGAKYYEIAKEYYDRYDRISEDLLLNFAELQSRDDLQTGRNVQYGRTLGSYVQLLTHRLRAADASERAAICAAPNALPTLSEVLEHFSKDRDRSRAYQNMCDLRIELREYEGALECLYRAICPDGPAPDTADMFRAVANEALRDKYIYLHAALLLHRLSCDGAYRGALNYRDMLKILFEGRSLSAEAVAEHLSAAEYPDIGILWHIAGAFARTGDERMQKSAKLLFDAAGRMSKGDDYMFRTIRIAIAAEEIALGLTNVLPAGNWKRDADALLCDRYAKYRGGLGGRVDPFDGAMPAPDDRDLAQSLLRAAARIAY